MTRFEKEPAISHMAFRLPKHLQPNDEAELTASCCLACSVSRVLQSHRIACAGMPAYICLLLGVPSLFVTRVCLCLLGFQKLQSLILL